MKEAFLPEPSSIRPSFSIEHRLVTDSLDGDRRGARRRAGKNLLHRNKSFASQLRYVGRLPFNAPFLKLRDVIGRDS